MSDKNETDSVVGSKKSFKQMDPIKNNSEEFQRNLKMMDNQEATQINHTPAANMMTKDLQSMDNTSFASIQRKIKQLDEEVNQALNLDTKKEAKVMVLYTGGTIGMIRNKEGYLEPKSQALEQQIRATCTMHDEEYSRIRFSNLRSFSPPLCQNAKVAIKPHLPLVLPHVPNHKRIIYTIYEYDNLVDSSNMTMADWTKIAKDIEQSYKFFDGFVILHGTDTLAYTASALSFMLENLDKTVIITGSQISSFETRSDGRDNIVGALILAGNFAIPEVSVFFNHSLLRGNRTVKMSAGDLAAFNSPNMSPLATVGVNIIIDYKSIRRRHNFGKFTVHSHLNQNVVLLKLFPSITTLTIKSLIKFPIEGVVLQCYGSGNIPNNKEILDILKEATDRGVIIICCTQCYHGSVNNLYVTGNILNQVGVIPGSDITTEAALTKLSYVLSKSDWSLEHKRKMMATNIAGEMTIFQDHVTGSLNQKKMNTKQNLELIRIVVETLNITRSEEIENIKSVLYPSIMCSTASYENNTVDMKLLIEEYDADVSCSNYDNRTPLHIAASEGNIEIAKYLLQKGANVHVRDRNNDSPLDCAIKFGHRNMIKMLIQCGAHFQLSPVYIGEQLCTCARQGDLAKLDCYRLAGACLNSENSSHQTALHAAVETSQILVVKFLLECQVDYQKLDIYGRTALDIAILLKKSTIAMLIGQYMK